LIRVEHLPQARHRYPVRAAVCEVEEYPWIQPPVVAEEHPAHIRHPVGEIVDGRELAGSAAFEQPSRNEAATRRQQRARWIPVTVEQVGDRPGEQAGKGGQVEHRCVAQVGRQRPDDTRHGQHRTTILRSARAQSSKSSE
jgi:hypothetical protein